MRHFFLFILLIALLVPLDRAQAQTYILDPVVGTDVAMISVQNLLAAPVLPGLGAGSHQFPVSVSYLTGTESYNVQALNASTSGSFTGEAVGLGYISPDVWDSVRVFGMVLGNQLHGSVTLTGSSGATNQLPDVQATGYAGAFGLGWRALGSETSIFSFGLFLAPAVAGFQSSFSLDDSSGTKQASFSSSATMYGPLAGVQIALRLGSFLINPYFLYFDDLSPSGRSLSTTAALPNNTVDVTGTFGAAGVILGVGNFQLCVYSAVTHNTVNDNITVQTYRLSYTF